MKFGVVVFPGSNCDQDCYYVINDILHKPVEYIWHNESDLSSFDFIILPGGFSYGDYLRSGAVARFSPVMQAVREHAGRGKLVLGICNGFQILLEAGLLPGAMLRNTSLKFRCKPMFLRVENDKLPFTSCYRKGEVIQIPIAHHEGNYYIDEEGLKEIKDSGQIVFRYANPDGSVDSASNPNGSVENIAGICNKEGNVLGMMPHPERAAESLLNGEDGKKIFLSAIRYLAGE